MVAPVGPIEAKERAVGWVLGEVERDELDAAIAAALLGARGLEEEYLVRLRLRLRLRRLEEARLG